MFYEDYYMKKGIQFKKGNVLSSFEFDDSGKVLFLLPLRTKQPPFNLSRIECLERALFTQYIDNRQNLPLRIRMVIFGTMNLRGLSFSITSC